ncbi:MAG: radical SAM family heme chaperone HemW [Bacteroidales bacterium]|nr:radical SAM family heme chaperone HemW [Bacteroidales bacterium]
MIYLHIPFCKSFCTYCGFYSEIETPGCYAKYADEICAEIKTRRSEFRGSLKTLYCGGGTPSLLPLNALAKILLALGEIGQGGPYEEFTMEVNPDDIVEKGVDYVKGLISLGVNRISIGVQSFDDDLLKFMNRRHDAAKAEKAVDIVREAGITNLSLDLIFGVGGMTADSWKDTVKKALDLHPEHISCYQLSIDEGSHLAQLISDGLYTEASEEDCREQYDLLCELCRERGFHHYEISNFALPGKEALHNSGYWSREPYVGLGPGAHSLSGATRSWNTRTLNEYSPEFEYLGEEEVRLESIMLSLRTDRGISAEVLRKQCDPETIERLVSEGALSLSGGRYRIPEDHFFVSDEIIRELI